MKIYPKTYEDVFTSKHFGREWLFKNLEDYSAEGFSSLDEFISINRKLFRKYYNALFDFLVKIYWLRRRLAWRGHKKTKDPRLTAGMIVEQAMGSFYRKIVGHDLKTLKLGNVYYKIFTYLPEMFPSLDDENALENEYKFPFRHMTIECMFFVYQLEDRMDLLRYGEEKGMNMRQFMDFVINQVLCMNEELGEKAFSIKIPASCLPYIKNIKYATYGKSRGKSGKNGRKQGRSVH